MKLLLSLVCFSLLSQPLLADCKGDLENLVNTQKTTKVDDGEVEFVLKRLSWTLREAERKVMFDYLESQNLGLEEDGRALLIKTDLYLSKTAAPMVIGSKITIQDNMKTPAITYYVKETRGFQSKYLILYKDTKNTTVKRGYICEGY